ncbi:MAG: pentapeptide repeat-containing protein [Candidatus Halichondribacter symbioticus]
MTLFIIAVIALSAVLLVIGIRQEWEKITILKVTYIIIASVVGFALFILFILLYSQILSLQCNIPTTADLSTMGETNVRNVAFAFIGTVSGLGGLFGVYLAILKSEENKRQSDSAESQARTAQQGLIIDQINKANESLDKKDAKKPVIPVRIGALYSLGRIAQDSLRDHIQIMEMFCSYIRYNSPCKSKSTRILKPLSEDIQTALTIIGRRGVWTFGEKSLAKEAEQRYRMDLQKCDLRGAILSRANLRGARFLNSNMNHVIFDDADLSNTWFEDTILNDAWFGGAKMDRAWACRGDFSRCRELTQEQLDVMYCGTDVKIPDGLTRPKHWPKDKLPFDKFQDGYFEWEKVQPDSYLKPQNTKTPAT